MKRLDPAQEGIRQYDCYGERKDSAETPILGEGEVMVILTEEDALVISAGLVMAGWELSRHASTRRQADPSFTDSPHDVATTSFCRGLTRLSEQMQQLLPDYRGSAEIEQRAVQHFVPKS